LVVNAAAWLDAAERAQIMEDTGAPIDPISGEPFTATVSPSVQSPILILVDRPAQDENGWDWPL
jgi:hypothetical protein